MQGALWDGLFREFAMESLPSLAAKTRLRRRLWKVGVAYGTIHAIGMVPLTLVVVFHVFTFAGTAFLFKGRFTELSNVTVGLGAVAKELVVSENVLETQNAFSPVVALVAMLVGTGFVLLVAHNARPSHRTVAVHAVEMACRLDPTIHASRKIGVTEAARRIRRTFQVAGFAVVCGCRCKNRNEQGQGKEEMVRKHCRNRT